MADRIIKRTKMHNTKIGSRVRNINLLLFFLVAGIILVSAVIGLNNISKTISKENAQLFSTRVNGILNTSLNWEIALMSNLTKSDEVIEWFKDEDNSEKQQRAYDRMIETINQLNNHNLYFGIYSGGKNNDYIIDKDENVGYPYSEFTHLTGLIEGDEEHSWYFKCKDSDYPYELNLDKDVYVGNEKIWLNVKVTEGGNFLGAIAT